MWLEATGLRLEKETFVSGRAEGWEIVLATVLVDTGLGCELATFRAETRLEWKWARGQPFERYFDLDFAKKLMAVEERSDRWRRRYS
jgi:hypothetical protein